jgi:UrcA family protein
MTTMTRTTSLTARISSAAMLALAALPLAALATNAHAGVSVKVSDLNLLSTNGQAAFSQRADQASRKFCADVRGVTAIESCRAGVREELAEKMEVVRLAQAAKAHQDFAAR